MFRLGQHNSYEMIKQLMIIKRVTSQLMTHHRMKNTISAALHCKIDSDTSQRGLMDVNTDDKCSTFQKKNKTKKQVVVSECKVAADSLAATSVHLNAPLNLLWLTDPPRKALNVSQTADVTQRLNRQSEELAANLHTVRDFETKSGIMKSKKRKVSKGIHGRQQKEETHVAIEVKYQPDVCLRLRFCPY